MTYSLVAVLWLLVAPASAPPPSHALRVDTTPAGAAPSDSGIADTIPSAARPTGAASPDTLAFDTVAFDSPATQALVSRVVRESGEIPDGLRDYVARVRSTVELALAPDTALGGELPVTLDEISGEVRWARPDILHQWVHEHHTRVLVPAPYSLGTILESPWVIPHLYGASIDALALSAGDGGARRGRPRALHPFSVEGAAFYRYEAGDTVRIRVQAGLITLVPVTVRPRAAPPDAMRPLVAGTFHVDVDRAAVARARFGFVEARRGLRIGIGRAGTYLELENALWEDRYWLPFRQRREQQVSLGVLGGAVAARIVSTISDYRLNSGWEPTATGRIRLFAPAPGTRPDFEIVADGAARGDWDVDDFADIRRLAAAGTRTGDPPALRVRPHVERTDHLFRYNRVEGAYLGAGVRLEPGDPLDRRWELYGTAGWAFAEGTTRGEVVGRLRPAARWPVPGATLTASAYRRLPDTRAFRPTFEWDWIQSLPAALAGTDRRDFYDARGAEVGVGGAGAGWRGRLGARWERQDSVRRNTDRYLFGEADEFPPLAPVRPGTRATLEAEAAHVRGAGAYGIGDGAVASLRGEAAAGDLGTHRLLGLLSFRRSFEPLSAAARLDAGHAFGDAPPQLLFRFGGAEGLGGYADNEFAGSSAAILRGRLLLGIPPRARRALARAGPFIIPPLRPSLVALGEAGWAHASAQTAPTVELLGARVTDGVRGSYGFGISVFDDALTLERLQPLDDDRPARWYFGITRWF
jgi:hypothetical protein